MKTAISIPDEVFAAAERLAKCQKKSRSRLYADAIAEYVARYNDDSITEAINRVLDEIGDEADPFLAEASRRVLERSEW
jgi:predicted transcriptional regulator